MEVDVNEYLLTSCRHTQQWSACLWDYTTGSAVHHYKNGGIVAPKSLNILANDYIFTCDAEKPLTHVWPLNSQEPTKTLSTVLPEQAQLMTVCPRAGFVAAAIGVKLYVWGLSSGKLFSVQKKNFQPITCLKFSSCGSYLVVAGQEGMLIVYDIVNLVSLQSNYQAQSDLGQVEPVYTKHDHSMPITDIHIGSFSHKSRLVTVSVDHTCKVYILWSGQLLLTLVFEEPLTSVVVDGPDWNLYVGMNSGKIQQFLLKEPPRTLEHHVSNDLVFQGHKKRVTCLDINMWNTNLVSGSDDNFVYIWQIQSRQIVRVIEHKAEITNVKFVMNHVNFFAEKIDFRTIVTNLERNIIDSDDYVDSRIQEFDIVLSSDDDDDNDEEDDDDDDDDERRRRRRMRKKKNQEDDSDELKLENTFLKAVNNEMYEAALEVIRKCHDF